MERLFLMLAGANGFLAVALGAFGAHGLRKTLDGLEDGAQRLAWWETAAQYHLVHAVALGLIAWLVGRTTSQAAAAGGWFFCAGILLFSGSLYAMTLTGIKVLGAVVPVGGVFFLLGWAALMVTSFKLS
jgi:uncharacterized membrane protein YgdD (TMEM256/DUF423 family)